MTSPESNGGNQVSSGFLVGEWTVLPSRNVIVRNGEEVRLEPRLVDVLVLLAEQADKAVSKEELTERVWKRQYVTDDVLAGTISALRKVLGDDARHPRYIETVSRRGYRLVAKVQPIGRAAPRAPAATPPQSRPARRLSRPTLAAALAVIILVASTWTLFGARNSRHVPSAESHEAYVKGRYFLDQRSIKGWQQALDHFRRAVVLDANYPAAHAGLADTYSAMSDFGVASPAEMRPLAMQSARRALELDPNSAEGLEALGRAQFLFDWDFAAAERNLTRALALDADYMPAYQAMAWLESARGRHTQAIAAARRALQLDPVNSARYTELAWVLALGGQRREALREVDRALQLNPRSWQTHVMQGWVHEVSGQPDSAFASYRNAFRVSGTHPDSLRRIESIYRTKGLPGYYRTWLDRRGGMGPVSETWTAQLYLRVGDTARALAALERAYEKREGALAWVNVEPTFDPLRRDARFQRIAARVGRAN